MKKLNGMKNFSSLENKKMRNLQTIRGGESALNYVYTNKGEIYDKETWVDHKLDSTLVID